MKKICKKCKKEFETDIDSGDVFCSAVCMLDGAYEPFNRRPETGTIQFGNDWPGVFIRGDNAMMYAQTLNITLHLLDLNSDNEGIDIFARAQLEGLLELLRSCREPCDKKSLQKLKDFTECLK